MIPTQHSVAEAHLIRHVDNVAVSTVISESVFLVTGQGHQFGPLDQDTVGTCLPGSVTYPLIGTYQWPRGGCHVEVLEPGGTFPGHKKWAGGGRVGRYMIELYVY